MMKRMTRKAIIWLALTEFIANIRVLVGNARTLTHISKCLILFAKQMKYRYRLASTDTLKINEIFVDEIQ